jgi:hypothetical protein
MQYRQLNHKEEESFREWAVVNYRPNAPVKEVWHPVVRDECEQINYRYALKENNEKEVCS